MILPQPSTYLKGSASSRGQNRGLNCMTDAFNKDVDGISGRCGRGFNRGAREIEESWAVACEDANFPKSNWDCGYGKEGKFSWEDGPV